MTFIHHNDCFFPYVSDDLTLAFNNCNNSLIDACVDNICEIYS